MTKLALYALAVLIAVFEIGVLTTALRPEVTEEYASYFIDRSSDCWATAVTGETRLNQELRFDLGPTPWPIIAHDIFVCGWIRPLDVGTWSHGSVSRMRLRFDPIPWADVLFHLEFKPLVLAAHPVQRAEFFANGERIAQLELTEASDPHHVLRLPARLIAAADHGRVEIEIRLPDAISPTALGVARDDRRLGIRLLSMRLETVEIASR